MSADRYPRPMSVMLNEPTEPTETRRVPLAPRFQAILDEQRYAELRIVAEGEATAPAPLAVLTGNTLDMGTVVELGRALARLGIRTQPQWIMGDDGLIAAIRLVEAKDAAVRS